MNYILKGKTPIQVELMEWAEWFEKADRHVNLTKLSNDIKVSTVFLGIDHCFDGSIPILFETMIFGGKHDEYCERYATWEQAEKGHEKAVKLVTTKPNQKTIINVPH